MQVIFAEKYAVYALCKRPRPQVSSSASQYLSTRLERVHGSNDDAFECHAALRCRSRKIVGGCAWGAYGWPFVLPQIKKAFAEVKEYKDLDRPKHHFQTHLLRALRNWGPFRGFWCMPFEGFLQVSTPHLEHTLPFSRSSISHTLSPLPSSPLLLLCS